MAAGIIALTLEANPQLTWRDVQVIYINRRSCTICGIASTISLLFQHIIVKTAKPSNLKATDWRSNGLRRNISHSFGYGLMDTGAMVRAALDWTNMPKQVHSSVTWVTWP